MAVTINAPIDRVWSALIDYEGYARFPKVKSARVIERGQGHPAGVGAVRELNVDGLTFVERIVEFEAPHRLAYKIVKSSPLPVAHDVGRMQLSERGSATELEWATTFGVDIPIVGGLLTHVVRIPMQRTFDAILQWVKRDLER
jgi:uncharacterized protein YndB with AHSA1/START domain